MLTMCRVVYLYAYMANLNGYLMTFLAQFFIQVAGVQLSFLECGRA